MRDARRIDVHLASATEPKHIGTIRAFEDGPLRAALAMSGIWPVELRWDLDQEILAIQVHSLDDVEKLEALGFEPDDQRAAVDDAVA